MFLSYVRPPPGPSHDHPLGSAWNSDTERRRLRKGHLHDLAMDQMDRFLTRLRNKKVLKPEDVDQAHRAAKDFDPDRLLMKGAMTAVQVNVVLVDEGHHYTPAAGVRVELEE